LREVSVRRAELTARVIGERVLDLVAILGDTARLSFSACTDGAITTAMAAVISISEMEAICREGLTMTYLNYSTVNKEPITVPEVTGRYF
jgi:hypothetical protein